MNQNQNRLDGEREVDSCKFCGKEAVVMDSEANNKTYSCPDIDCPGAEVVEPIERWNMRPAQFGEAEYLLRKIFEKAERLDPDHYSVPDELVLRAGNLHPSYKKRSSSVGDQ